MRTAREVADEIVKELGVVHETCVECAPTIEKLILKDREEVKEECAKRVEEVWLSSAKHRIAEDLRALDLSGEGT